MTLISITHNVDTAEISDNLVNELDSDQLVEFICDIDKKRADWEFTINLTRNVLGRFVGVIERDKDVDEWFEGDEDVLAAVKAYKEAQ